MFYVRAAAFAAALAVFAASPAPAMTAADLAQVSATPDSARAEAELNYFDHDALVTLGALALAIGALAGAGVMRRRSVELSREPAWRASVFRAVETDLAHFTQDFLHAA